MFFKKTAYKAMQPDNFDQKVFTLLASIPAGRVTTYGDIAKRANMPRSARLVGRILSQLPIDTELPWHRVVNANGKISLPESSASYKVQKDRLEREGIAIINNRIKLQKYEWGL